MLLRRYIRALLRRFRSRLKFLDLPLHLEEDRQDREDRRIDVGAVARSARVLPRLVQQAVERLAVLLPQRPAVVHPVVQDRLEMQPVRRDRAAHAGTCAVSLKDDAGGGMPETTPSSRRVVARLIRASESLSGPSPPRRDSGFHAIDAGESSPDLRFGGGSRSFRGGAARSPRRRA